MTDEPNAEDPTGNHDEENAFPPSERNVTGNQEEEIAFLPSERNAMETLDVNSGSGRYGNEEEGEEEEAEGTVHTARVYSREELETLKQLIEDPDAERYIVGEASRTGSEADNIEEAEGADDQARACSREEMEILKQLIEDPDAERYIVGEASRTGSEAGNIAERGYPVPSQPPPPQQQQQQRQCGQRRNQGQEEEKEEIPAPVVQPQPGAYRNVPGEAAQRAEKIRFGLLGVDTAQNNRTSSHPNTPSSVEGSHLRADGSSDLAVARPLPVEEQEGLPQAEEVDPIINEQRARQMWQFKAKVIAVGLLCVVAIVLAVVLTRTADQDASPMMGLDPDGTEVPTSAPTLSPESYVKSLLPYYTVMSIEQDGTSPQYEAFLFILEDLEWNSDYSVEKLRQRFALVTFFRATGGSGWKDQRGWLQHDVDECDWFSGKPKLDVLDRDTGSIANAVQIADHPCEDGVYKHLAQYGNNVNGTLPPEVFELLPSLVSVNLDPQGSDRICTRSFEDEICGYASDYIITGSIPSEIGLCSQLEYLSLDYQRLSGGLPANLGSLSLLKYLRLYDNKVTGEISLAVGNTESLTLLDLGGNLLHGTIPSEIGLMSNLTSLDLSYTDLTGTIPSEIWRMPNLKRLCLDGTDLTGTIPTEIGLVSSLELLCLYYTDLTGTIPSEIWLMPKLTSLDLSGTNLTGTIPSEIGLMSKLTDLGLVDIGLTGTIPSEIGLMSSLEILFAGTDLTGTIPSEIGLMVILKHLYLTDSKLTGTIPSEIGLMSSLMWLSLSDTGLTGTIPSEIGLVTNSFFLDISDTDLTGTIPSEILLTSNLLFLFISATDLTGTIPDGISELCVVATATMEESNGTVVWSLDGATSVAQEVMLWVHPNGTIEPSDCLYL